MANIGKPMSDTRDRHLAKSCGLISAPGEATLWFLVQHRFRFGSREMSRGAAGPSAGQRKG